MEGFTYYDYIYYKKYLKNDKRYISGLMEKEQEYKLEIKEENQDHDKTYRMILSDKDEASKLINKTLKLGKYKLNENDIEKYTNRFITNDYKNRETDIVFRKKDENIFFLIEHQSKIDYSMPYRLLIYNTEIIKSAVNERRLNTKGYKLPTVYPIVLYTGKKKWDVKKYLEQCQMRLKGCQIKPYTGYYLVDINTYEEEYLLSENDFLSKILLIEKATTNQILEDNLQKIIDSNLKDKQKVMLRKIIYYTLSKKIGRKKAEIYVEKLESKTSYKKSIGGKSNVSFRRIFRKNY